MLGDIPTSFLALEFSSVGARHAVPERTRSNRTPSTETVLPMFALKFPPAINPDAGLRPAQLPFSGVGFSLRQLTTRYKSRSLARNRSFRSFTAR
jgi:hypothetical protein